ncbi:MAG: NADH-quinone oxidoreductase subunit L [Bdellovibrionaceae bacterium]|nr:NADH-quinone oxidoreductase subunit L [Pseudobdellovibrionaceae bacterium]
MVQNCIWIFSLPLIAFVLQASLGKKLPRQGDFISVIALLGSFLLALPIFLQVVSTGNISEAMSFTWISLPLPIPDSFLTSHPGISSPTFNLDIGILLNNPTAIMLGMVTFCCFLIHLFSTGYMKGEDRYHMFFAYISLFSAAMLGLVVSDNLFTFFMCWEVMGVCSYALIGFYYKKPSAINASIKAFMTTRVGDTCFFLGLMGLYIVFGTSNFSEIYQGLQGGFAEGKTILGVSALSFIGFMIMMGTIGKSAQFPLQIWLPDAMEGPTPVSALIHAATMVSGGVFLLIRTFPILEAGHVLPIIAYVGAITAFLAAMVAVVQTDIKKVLAYSTISQLGYMVMGIGVGAFAAAFLHLITHALFKACLFLCSGSVIHAVHTQDMREMGALRTKMPLTFISMLIATLAISGVPFFSGFVSKDRILGGALAYGMEHQVHALIPILGFAAALLTAFYMFRLIYMTFCGPAKDEHKHTHAHEMPWNMVLPTLLLSGLSLSIWFAGPTGIHGLDPFEVHWFDNAVAAAQTQAGIALHHGDEHIAHSAHGIALVLSLILATAGILLATFTYLKHLISADAWKSRLAPLYNVLVHKYYFDELYINVIIQRGLLVWNNLLARFDDRVVDRILVDGWKDISMGIKAFIGKFDDLVVDRIFVDGTGYVTAAGGWILRRFQTGRVQQYVILSLIGFTVAFICLVAGPK